MAIMLDSRHRIDRVKLIDDDPEVRALYKYSVEDLELFPEEISGPIGDAGTLIETFDSAADAAICDYNLKSKNYANTDGSVVVSKLYSRNVPAVLCTRWAGHVSDQIRYWRRRIPVVLSPNELNPETLLSAFEVCAKEFGGGFSDFRRPWRAMVRVESAEDAGGGHIRLNLVIPSWKSSVGLSYVVPPQPGAVLQDICRRAMVGEVVRSFGQVNLGVESDEDVYIDDWTM